MSKTDRCFTPQSSFGLHANAPIGIFDSGVGGLSVARCIYQQLSHEHLIYVADSAFAPYGSKSNDQIIVRVNKIADSLIAKGVKAIVVACNTATVNAIDQLRARVSIPIIGIEPAIKPAAFASKTNAVGLMVTSATATNARFLQLVAKYSGDAQTFIQPCPGLVEQIETQQLNSEKTFQLLQSYLAPLLAKNIDQLVLGCTHYPFLSEQISAITGAKVALLETAEPVTKELQRKLTNLNIYAPANRKGHVKFFTTGDVLSQEALFSSLWPKPVILEALKI